MSEPHRPDPRRVAAEALVRIDVDGAFANLVLPHLLERSGLDRRDRAFATDLVYGTTRMQRACDHLVDRFLFRPVDPDVRAVLRLGAYQLHVLQTPPHAAVGATVSVAPTKARGLVNAVLRRVADAGPKVAWPDVATRLSYPDWVVARLTTDIGEEAAVGALEAMNEAPSTTARADGYVQDLASQWVAELVEAQPGERVADVCAAPGGKTTLMAGTGAWIAASDVRPVRSGLVAGNAARLGLGPDRIAVITADATAPPYRPGSFVRVLVDAPCSGLGTLRRRPDARWRIEAGDVPRLAALQRDIVDAAVGLLMPGGLLVYSACTLTAAESTGVDQHIASRWPDLHPLPTPDGPWQPLERGAILLPQAAGTDGMVLFRYRMRI